jgi:translation initiation factor eIF-2B subunit delta|tara:strand:- start:1820 stop:2644 length:825 start_codon:yes stop_codon:yes gene_type:complete
VQQDKLLNDIANDRTHGSTDLALLALDGISKAANATDTVLLAVFQQRMQSLIRSLQSSRPSMVALNNLLERVRLPISQFNSRDLKAYRKLIIDHCAEAKSFAREAQSQAVIEMVNQIKPGDVIMTHSISSTIKKVLSRLSKTRVHIIVTESRPGDEGKVLAAYLVALGMRPTYITEAQINLWMPRANKVVVGADALLEDGSIINKCGTSLMAMSARYHGVPVYVCAESFKQTNSNAYELEQMDPGELKLNVAGVKVSNWYFERVAPDLITKWIH